MITAHCFLCCNPPIFTFTFCSAIFCDTCVRNDLAFPVFVVKATFFRITLSKQFNIYTDMYNVLLLDTSFKI